MSQKNYIKNLSLIFFISSVFTFGSLAQTGNNKLPDSFLLNTTWNNNYRSSSFNSGYFPLPDFKGSIASLSNPPAHIRLLNFDYHNVEINDEKAESDTHIEAPYLLNWKYNGTFTGAGFALYGASALIRSNEQPLSLEQIGGLESNSLWTLDRGATKFSSNSAHQASNFFLYSSMVTPAFYLTKEKTRKDFSTILLMQAETLILTNAITSLTKTLIYRPRPYTYNESLPLEDKLSFNARESFFSGHVAATASMSFFTATTFSQYYPDSKLKPLVWSYAVLWPAATGYFRYTAGKHFPTDILTGYLVGAMTGILIPKIHQKLAKKKQDKKILRDYNQ